MAGSDSFETSPPAVTIFQNTAGFRIVVSRGMGSEVSCGGVAKGQDSLCCAVPLAAFVEQRRSLQAHMQNICIYTMLLQGLNFDPSSNKEAARVAFNALSWVADKRPLAFSNARVGPVGKCQLECANLGVGGMAHDWT